jgi:hypothetical protein
MFKVEYEGIRFFRNVCYHLLDCAVHEQEDRNLYVKTSNPFLRSAQHNHDQEIILLLQAGTSKQETDTRFCCRNLKGRAHFRKVTVCLLV